MRYIIWLLIILATQACSSSKQREAKSPNLLFIMMDDLGYGHFGPNNMDLTVDEFNPWFVRLVNENQDYSPEQSLAFSKSATPTMSRLASEGVLFTHAFTSSNLCAPSRLGIATGIQQNRLGVYRNLDCEARGLDQGSHLAEVLQDMGYATAHIGKWHIGQRDRTIIDRLADSLGLDMKLDRWGNLNKDPEVHRAFMNSGYLGSVIDEDNPRQNGFDYYYGYNYWASQFYN
ncbi:MAG: sulfatase-like hydrolase/transferase, partial [Bacteroidales bacterium]